MKEGDLVDYHSLRSGPITSKDHEILFIERFPNNFGCDVAWITKKSGCVALANLTPAPNTREETP